MKTTLKFLPAIALLLALTSCNSVDGAGKDMQKGGDAVRDAAN